MNKDGAKISVWQNGSFLPTNKLQQDLMYDVVIAGAGITGLTTALLLQQQGMKCVLADAHSIGFGSSGGTTAHLNTMLDSSYADITNNFGAEAAKLCFQATTEAIQLVEKLSRNNVRPTGFSYKTGYLFAKNEEQASQLEKIVAAAKDVGVPIQFTDSIPLISEVHSACSFHQQAELSINDYLLELATAFEQAGGVILQHCTVYLPEHEGSVPTSVGNINTKKVVFATHIPPGVNILHFRCAPYRSYAAAVTLQDENYPDGLIYDMEDPYHYYRTLIRGDKKYLIAGGFDHKTGHEENTDVRFRTMRAFLHNNFNINSIDFQWSSQYYIPADGLPYIGLLPGYDHVYTGTGFNGDGMTLGTLSAIIISEEILGRENKYAALFRPSRIKPIAGFTAFVKENADVISQFIGKRFAYEQLESLASLANGEASLASYEGHKIALYKDEKGKLHALDPVCPHAKCIVGWNSAEKTWDCPCHGARYAPDGTLLTGPATKGLTKLSLGNL